jgi:hypothetical protein
MQDDLTGGRLAVELIRLLEPEANKTMRESLEQVTAKLGPPGASYKAAGAVLRFLSRRTEAP